MAISDCLNLLFISFFADNFPLNEEIKKIGVGIGQVNEKNYDNSRIGSLNWKGRKFTSTIELRSFLNSLTFALNESRI